MDLRIAIGVVVSIALFSAMQALYWYLRGRRRRVTSDLRDRVYGRGEGGSTAGGIRIRGRDADEPDDNALMRRVAEVLTQGGFRAQPGRFLGLAGASTLGAFVLVALATGSALSGLAAAAFAVFALYVYVTRRRDQRLKQFDTQLPRALELMVFGLQAGHALEEALHLAADEVGQPLSSELARCYEEYSLGRPIESALEQMRERWRSVGALNALVEAVVLLKRTGGNLVEVLETLNEGLRAQAAYEARHRALTAEGRLSAFILMGLPFVGLLTQALLSPGQLTSMVRDGGGQVLLAIGFLMWLVGSLWVLQLTKPARQAG